RRARPPRPLVRAHDGGERDLVAHCGGRRVTGSAARAALIAVALAFLGAFLVLPVVAVFAQALSKGVGAYVRALADPEALSAPRLTLLVAAIAVPLNAAFGLAASWAIAKFSFPGKTALLTAIDTPIAVSPVVSGLVLVLLFGRRAPFGAWLSAHG